MATTQGWDVGLARAVSARTDGVRVATRDRAGFTNDFRHRPWPAGRPDGPVAVYLAREGFYYTLAFDIDAGGAEACEQADLLGSILELAGIRYVTAMSGPAGHRHLICTWSVGLDPVDVARVARKLRELAPDLDVAMLLNPATGCLRPPGGSPPRRGSEPSDHASRRGAGMPRAWQRPGRVRAASGRARA